MSFVVGNKLNLIELGDVEMIFLICFHQEDIYTQWTNIIKLVQ